MLVAWTVPSHYLNQRWHKVNRTLVDKRQWNFNRNSNIFHNAIENIVWKMAAILSQPRCVKWHKGFFSIISDYTKTGKNSGQVGENVINFLPNLISWPDGWKKHGLWVPFQYPIRTLIVRSCESRSRKIGSLIHPIALKLAAVPSMFLSNFRAIRQF